jgi:hypothetical protein
MIKRVSQELRTRYHIHNVKIVTKNQAETLILELNSNVKSKQILPGVFEFVFEKIYFEQDKDQNQWVIKVHDGHKQPHLPFLGFQNGQVCIPDNSNVSKASFFIAEIHRLVTLYKSLDQLHKAAQNYVMCEILQDFI